MKNLVVQFKSGRTLDIKDICDYVESQDFDVVVFRNNNKEVHATIFHDAIECMYVNDTDVEMKEYETGLDEAWECARKITNKDIDTEEIFGDIPLMFIFRKYSASKAMAKIKEWEDKCDKKYETEVITRGNCMMCGKELTEGLFFCKECEEKANAEKDH